MQYTKVCHGSAPQRGLTLRTMINIAPAPVAQSAQLRKTEIQGLAQVG